MFAVDQTLSEDFKTSKLLTALFPLKINQAEIKYLFK